MAFLDSSLHSKTDENRQSLYRWFAPLFARDKAILNPVADAVLFYTTPLWCVLLFWALSDTPLWYTMEAFDYQHGPLSFLAGVLTTSHLLAVVFRSHVNQSVFRQWPLRFTVIPVLLFIALSMSLWFLVIAAVIAVFWDVYHGAMQNFGLSRIFDSRMGNDPKAGRLLDSMMSLVLYAGPILSGVTLAFHAESFNNFAEIGLYALTVVPTEVTGHAVLIRWVTMSGCLLFIGFYIAAYWNLARQGYKVSPQKVILMASTGLASVIAWGFNPAAIAFAAMNLFHAIQYYGILYAREGKTLSSTFRFNGLPKALRGILVCAILFIPTLAFGVWEFFATPGWDMILALILTVTLMHYWYDGFVWSVRKKQV